MKITVIPQSKKMFSSESLKSNAKRKVAAYARVSTDNDEQLNSYEAQIEYYTSLKLWISIAQLKGFVRAGNNCAVTISSLTREKELI